MDGTILPTGHPVRPRVVQALREAHERGVVLAVSSGRPRALLQGVVTDLGVMDYYVTSDGACVSDARGRVIMRRPIARDKALQLVRALRPQRAAWRAMFGPEAYGEPRSVSYLMGQRGPAAQDGDGLLAGLRAGLAMLSTWRQTPWHDCLSVVPQLRRHLDGVEKLDCSFPTPEALRDALGIIDALGGLTSAQMTPIELEITHEGVTKGTGCSWLEDHLGIEPARAVAFGDGGNDLPIVGHVGTFVAMGNADAVVRERADQVCPSIDEDGVAVWLEQAMEGTEAGQGTERG